LKSHINFIKFFLRYFKRSFKYGEKICHDRVEKTAA
jgi:hypothetical protein